ncbi:MAG: hypothetical protein ABSE49_13370 [Polyangiaceae bacterium]
MPSFDDITSTRPPRFSMTRRASTNPTPEPFGFEERTGRRAAWQATSALSPGGCVNHANMTAWWCSFDRILDEVE